MVFLLFQHNKNVLKSCIRKFSTEYEIPERYRNCFYLANASLFDSVSWYLHRAYEIYFTKLVAQLQEKESQLPTAEAEKKIFDVIQMLDQCNSIIDVRFPLKRDSGRREIIRGFRAQHGLFSGFNTCLGGLRIKENITRDHMKGLAVLSTYKHSCMGIRLAGAHGGIKINPCEYSLNELQRIVETYTRELYNKGYANGLNDVIEPDLNTGRREMGWIANLFTTIDGKKPVGNSVVMGKCQDLGGIEHHDKAGSQGVYFALDYFLNDEKVMNKIGFKNLGLKGKTYIIQGLGKLGTALVSYLENSGAICVGVKEYDCCVFNPSGISIKDLLEHKSKKHTILNYPNVKPIVSDEIFTDSCDILILAAQQKSVNCYVAEKIKARIIVEAANASITPNAHRILVSQKKLVLPDIYVCSGYSVASYLEYLLNLQIQRKEMSFIRGIYKVILENLNVSQATNQLVASSTMQKIKSCEMEPDAVTCAFDHVMTETAHELLDIAKEYNLELDLRISGYIKAIRSIHNSVYDTKKY